MDIEAWTAKPIDSDVLITNDGLGSFRQNCQKLVCFDTLQRPYISPDATIYDVAECIVEAHIIAVKLSYLIIF